MILNAIDPNLLVALTIIIGQIITAVLAWQTRGIAQKTELNTNSMKDALVQATMVSAHAAGMQEGRLAGERKAATFAKGKLAGAEPEPEPAPVEIVNPDPVVVKVHTERKRK